MAAPVVPFPSAGALSTSSFHAATAKTPMQIFSAQAPCTAHQPLCPTATNSDFSPSDPSPATDMADPANPSPAELHVLLCKNKPHPFGCHLIFVITSLNHCFAGRTTVFSIFSVFQQRLRHSKVSVPTSAAKRSPSSIPFPSRIIDEPLHGIPSVLSPSSSIFLAASNTARKNFTLPK